VDRRGFTSHCFNGVAGYFFTGAVLAVLFLAVLFLVLFLPGFTVLFRVVVRAAALGEPAAAGAAFAWANVRGTEATASAIASNVVFIFSLPAGSARLQFHTAPEHLEAR
jgi:hypothetical protein